jgi:NADH-quinone oxidoreductase subunit L
MTMTLPLIVLAIGSALVGFLGIPHSSMFEAWLEPVIKMASGPHAVEHASDSMEFILMGVSVLVAAVSMFFAYTLYGKNFDTVNKIRSSKPMQGLAAMSENKWYFDEIYQSMIIKPLLFTSEFIFNKLFDNTIIDGIVNGTSNIYEAFSYGVRDIQSGKVRHYAYLMLFGILMMFVYTMGKMI